MSKVCCTCKEEKPLQEFYQDKSKRDGRHSKCKRCALAYRVEYYGKHKDKLKVYFRAMSPRYAVKRHDQYHEDKVAALNAYGNVCVCCAEAEPLFLTFDHINNDGNIHRASDKGAANICSWLRRNNYPQNIVQILCFNCNIAKHVNGGICPHED